MTHFHETCRYEHLEIIKFLIKDPRVDINTSNIYGATAFHFACSYGDIDIIYLFFSSNRKIDFKKKLIERCFFEGSGKTGFDILKEKISNNQKLLFSAADGDVETLKELLKIKKNLKF